ncbi:MAG: carbohydrate kinase [Pseudomonadota bacterium]
MSNSNNVLCFGEILWDALPDGRHAGGAPLNVAYHLSRLGATGWPVSAVGDDELGTELLQLVSEWGMPSDFIGTSATLPTGTVQVSLDRGSPTYDILCDVAWDRIRVPDPLPERARPVDAVLYGTLALRDLHNRHALRSLLEQAREALHVFDVNLRPPHDDRDFAWQLARRANLIKLNDVELAFLLERPAIAENVEASTRQFAERCDAERVCVTCGASGAGLLDSGRWYWVKSRPVAVRDTIGAGDAFLAALVHGTLTRPERPADTLAFASELAGFVAASDGAMPAYTDDDIERWRAMPPLS